MDLGKRMSKTWHYNDPNRPSEDTDNYLCCCSCLLRSILCCACFLKFVCISPEVYVQSGEKYKNMFCS